VLLHSYEEKLTSAEVVLLDRLDGDKICCQFVKMTCGCLYRLDGQGASLTRNNTTIGNSVQRFSGVEKRSNTSVVHFKQFISDSPPGTQAEGPPPPASEVWPDDEPRLVRPRRSATLLEESLMSVDDQLLPPRNLQIMPVRFGALNISWVPATANEHLVTHYQLVLINLSDRSPTAYTDKQCQHIRSQYTSTHSDEGPFVSGDGVINAPGQLTVNVTAPASHVILTDLPPDNFYRVLLFAMAGSRRSPPASMPSSPRVPALPPQTAPREVKITPRGTQGAKISWLVPDDLDCTGELIGYVITIKSLRLIEPLMIKVPGYTRSHMVEDLIPGTFYTVQVSATTRGGVGVPTRPVEFRTGGEVPTVDLGEDLDLPFAPDELVDLNGEGIHIQESSQIPPKLETHIPPTDNLPLYMVPAKASTVFKTDYLSHLLPSTLTGFVEHTGHIEPNLNDSSRLSSIVRAPPNEILCYFGHAKFHCERNSLQKSLESSKILCFINLLSGGTDAMFLAGYDQSRDPWLANKEPVYNLRANPTQNTILLRWSVALRRLDMENEREMLSNPLGGNRISMNSGPMPIRLSADKKGEDHTAYLPQGTKYVIRWGDMHPGPAEDSVTGDQTQYLIQDLKPGTIYYIRVIAVTRLGEGPAAYTVTMTRNQNEEPALSTSDGPLIPVNLFVQTVGATWASVGWELPQTPTAIISSEMMFQIKYYPIDAEAGNRKPPKSRTNLVNVTIPKESFQRDSQSRHFKAMLRGLTPATQYEFGVCLLQPRPKFDNFQAIVTGPTLPFDDFCSMVQGFETFGQIPKDYPKNIKIQISADSTSPELQRVDFGSGTQSTPPPTLATEISLQWESPSHPNGKILAYSIYLTRDNQKSVGEWTERTVPGTVSRIALCGLEWEQTYFLRIAARNRHGLSPLSPVVAFRTPSANGEGGGMFELSKAYHDARDIDEALETPSSGPERTDGDKGSGSVKDNLRWVITGSVLGGALVIMIVVVIVLCIRCQATRRSVGRVKRSSSKQPYIGAFQNCYQSTDPNHPGGFVGKPHGFNFTDVCLGGCSLTGSNVGGSNTGSLGFQTGEISVVQTHELGNPMSAPSHTSSCSCSDWRTRGEISCAPNNNQCPCSAHLDPCSHPMWVTGIGQSAIQPTSGGCADDRHSTPAGSDSETGGGSGGGGGRGIGLGRKFSARVGTRNLQSDAPLSCNHKESWCRVTNENLLPVLSNPQEMTLSFLAANAQVPSPFRPGHFPKSRVDDDFSPPTNLETGSKNPVLPNDYHQQLLRSRLEDRSPEFSFVQTRPVTGGGGGGSGLTGSDSLNGDDMTTWSPNSSSAGRGSTGVHPVSTSPLHSSTQLKKYVQQQLADRIDYGSKRRGSGPIQELVNGAQYQVTSPQKPPVDHPKILPTSKPFKSTEKNTPTSQNWSPVLNIKENRSVPPQSDRTVAFGPSSGIVRVNAMSSDYASQQSSLSNPSSNASSNVGMRFSPEGPTISTGNLGAALESGYNSVGLSFALDRVPTPEPTPRPVPISRLRQTATIPDQSHCDAYLSKGLSNGKSVISAILSRKNDKAAPTKTDEGSDRERTPDSADSVSEHELLASSLVQIHFSLLHCHFPCLSVWRGTTAETV
ncbi:unnamed protein product, partial [Calicophoron daubneyi]